MFTKRFDAALCFAADLHGQQVRKGTNVPYIGHLLAVAALVIEDDGSEAEAIAALLHDSIEDQAVNFPGGREALRAYIRDHFGIAVAGIVDACTDDEGFVKGLMGTPEQERERWLERKRKYTESIARKDSQGLRVTAADKVHNVESILDSHAAIGPEVWNRFRTKSRSDQIEIYRNLAKAITSRNDEFPAQERTGLTKRLLRAVRLMESLS